MSSPRKAKRTVSRQIPLIQRAEIRAYAAQSGEILWFYNRIHATFADMFAHLIDGPNGKTGRAVWHSVKADSAQRDMLIAAVETSEILDKRVAEGIEWLIDVAGILSRHRNDIAHTPMRVDLSVEKSLVIPDPWAGDRARVARLSRKDRARFHSKLKGDLVALSKYAMPLYIAVFSGGVRVGPLPRRPRLQSIPPNEVPLTRSQKRRREAMQQQKRQQRPSLG